MLECVFFSSLRQVISETHGILKTQLPCYKQMEGKMLVVSNSGILPDLFSPKRKELLAASAEMTVSAEALISRSESSAFPSQCSCFAGMKRKKCTWPLPVRLTMISLPSLCINVLLFLFILLQKLCLTPK